jgi:glucosamine-6-phosphate deaminase
VKVPHVVVQPDRATAGSYAAALIDQAIRTRAGIVLALPTGATPISMYAELVRLHRTRGTDWRGVTTFNLDEYVGIPPDHPESYARYMHQHLFGGVNLPPERRHLPDGLAPDPPAEATRYEAAIEAAGGIDLAVLGVGTNGHLGFNEPGARLTAPTHVATLEPETWRRNFPALAAELTGQFPADRPFQRAFTVGIGTILQARAIVLVAVGATKREIVRAALNGPITTHNPASLLQLHRHVTVVLDREAASS